MNSEEQKIIDIKVKYEDAIYGIMRFQEKIEKLKAAQGELNDQFNDGTISSDEYRKQTEAISAVQKEYNATIRSLRKELQNNVKVQEQQEGSLKQLRAELSNATKAYDEMSKVEREGAAGHELQKHIRNITDELKQAEEETERYYRNVGNYYNSMMDAAGDLANTEILGYEIGDGLVGNTIALGRNLEGLQGKLQAFGKSALALFTNPYFLAMAGVVGTGMAFKWFYDYNKGLMEASRLTTEFLGITGDAMKSVRNEIMATSNAMGTSFQDTLSTIDGLAAQFGISVADAMKVVQDGFEAGGNLSGDMLDKLTRFAPAFHDAGLSASELAAAIAQTRSGIFTDDGMNAIVMGSKKIREMSTATAASLAAIGIDSRQVTADLSNGSKTTFEVLQEIGKKLNDVGANSKEAGEILTNVFGRQGVMAGQELIKSFENMSLDIDEVKKQTGEWGDTQHELIEANAELQNTMSALFDVTDKGFEEWIENGKLIATRTLVSIMQSVVKVANYMIDLYNNSRVVRGGVELVSAAFKNMWNTCKLLFSLMIDGVKNVGRGFQSLATIIEGAMTFDADKIKAGLNEIANNFATTGKEVFEDVKSFGENTANAYLDAFNNTINNADVAYIKIPEMEDGKVTTNNVSSSKSGSSTNSTSKTDSKKTEADTKREQEELKKQQKELQEAILKIQMEYSQKQMDIKKMYLNGMYADDKAYQADLDALEKEQINALLNAYVSAGNIGAEKAQEMQQKLLDLMIKAKQQIAQNTKDIVDDIAKQFEEQEKLRRETDITSGGTGEETDDAAKLERLRAFLEQQMGLYQNNADVRKQLEEQIHDTEIALQEDANKKIQAKLQAQQQTMANIIQAMGDGLADFFNEEDKSLHSFLKSMLTSVLSAIETAITAYYAQIMAKEIASKSWGGVASAAALMALVKVAFAGAKAMVKNFATGGYVSGEGTATSDSIPARLSNGESVMTAKATSMFSPLLSTFNQLGGGVPIVVASPQTSMGEDMLAAAVAKGMMMAPTPVVSVEEIDRVKHRVEVIENISKI